MRRARPLDITAPRSYWLDSVVESRQPRLPLAGPAHADIAIVGGGYTGMWAAWWLRQHLPQARIIILEAAWCGFGASGRNGGWASALLPHHHSDLDSLMQAAVVDLGERCAHMGIDCDYHRGGTYTLVTNPAQTKRVASLGGEWLNAQRLESEFRVAGATGASYTPHCARIHPAKLAFGLARALEAAGVTIHERTVVKRVTPHLVETSTATGTHTVTADHIVIATEGYTRHLDNRVRDVVPIASMMIATEPLGLDRWEAIGLDNAATFTDGRSLIVYGQRTADGRMVFGGRGAPYRFGSGTTVPEANHPIFQQLHQELLSLFPHLDGIRITHKWGGVLGVTRAYQPVVWNDPTTGVAVGCGYVGDGVTTAMVAGQTLAELIAGVQSERTESSLVRPQDRRWEPEPFRWLGINGASSLASMADRFESRTARPARIAHRIINRLTGGH